MSNVNTRTVPEFDENFLKLKFERKIDECKKRMISFKFTEEEWLGFHKLIYVEDIRCAYTNTLFEHKRGNNNYPTIERLDNTKPYSVENCVWVTHLANNLKANYIESNGDEGKLLVSEKNFLTRIRKIVDNVENIQEVQKPYKHLFSDTEKEVCSSNPEIKITKMYSEYGDQIEGFGAAFKLTYSQFKNLITRKKCQLTQRVLPDNLQDRFVWVIDKSIQVDKSNVLITDKDVANTLDLLQGKCKLTIKDLKTLGKTLNGL